MFWPQYGSRRCSDSLGIHNNSSCNEVVKGRNSRCNMSKLAFDRSSLKLSYNRTALVWNSTVNCSRRLSFNYSGVIGSIGWAVERCRGPVALVVIKLSKLNRILLDQVGADRFLHTMLVVFGNPNRNLLKYWTLYFSEKYCGLVEKRETFFVV